MWYNGTGAIKGLVSSQSTRPPGLLAFKNDTQIDRRFFTKMIDTKVRYKGKDCSVTV